MRILITGNLGYVGSCLGKYLREQYPEAYLVGYDYGYFQHCLTTDTFSPERALDAQIYGDVRNFDASLLENIDHVIHLAAISNDPIGNQFEQVTLDVNYKATVDIAEKAVLNGVKSFVFPSSCSVYGIAGNGVPANEQSAINPLTAYARSKVMAEKALQEMKAGDTVITCLRFATACGMSDRLRLDLVLNDFVASAFTSKRIDILSDGTPWRPLINVRDMARAIDWAMNRNPADGGNCLVCNAGSNEWNYTVKELAENVKNMFQNTEVSINSDAPPDRRSYRVNFDLFTSLANGYEPVHDLERTILEIKNGLDRIDFNDPEFRQSKLIRLNVLNKFIKNGNLDTNLQWRDDGNT